jgi:hypothetical protein
LFPYETVGRDPGIRAVDLDSLVDDLGILFQVTALTEFSPDNYGITKLTVQCGHRRSKICSIEPPRMDHPLIFVSAQLARVITNTITSYEKRELASLRERFSVTSPNIGQYESALTPFIIFWQEVNIVDPSPKKISSTSGHRVAILRRFNDARCPSTILVAFRNTRAFVRIQTDCERTPTISSDQRLDTASYQFESLAREEVLMS